MDLGERAEMHLLEGLAERLRHAGHGQRGRMVEEGARALGISTATLYQRLRRAGWHSGRKLRTDRGDSRVTEEEVRQVAALLGNRRLNGKRLMVVGDALEIALANGLLKTRVSAQTLLRLMRLYNCHPAQIDQPTPHQPLQSRHPNHCWQLDPSLCVLFYLPRQHGLAVMDERSFNARKPVALSRTLKERVLRYVISDHCSGSVFVRYVQAPGESQAGLFDVLMEAMTQREGHVMHGVPWQLVWDMASANQAHGVQNLLRALGVRCWPHIAGNPRAKGQVECANNLVERLFESRLAFMEVRDLDELNAAADAWCRDFNSYRIHRRHGHTRWALWQTIRADQLRLCPPRELCEVLMHTKPEPRTVAGNLTVSFRPRGHERADYSVAHIPEVRVGDSLQVIVNPYRAPAIYVVLRDENNTERFVECAPIERTAAGFFATAPIIGERYARPADTVVDESRKDIAERLWGSRDRDAADKARKAGRPAMAGAVDPMADIAARAADLPAHMQRPGTALDLPNPVQIEDRPLDHIEVLYELRARLGRTVDPREAAAVRTWYPDGVPADELDAVLTRVQHLDDYADTQPPTVPRLRAVT
ncbi:MAG TPA: hypothetical protein PKZ76_03450 [Xanthomonadaceae bacterium]|nr:hypothetical protein [Xanthomonadaceae bacterium]